MRNIALRLLKKIIEKTNPLCKDDFSLTLKFLNYGVENSGTIKGPFAELYRRIIQSFNNFD